MKEAVVLYSGGLDSKLAIKILESQGFKIHALYFKLPFGCSCKEIDTTKEDFKIVSFDTTKEPLLSEYLELIKNPKFGTGTSINPCKDCKIFMFKKAKEYADSHKIKVIATGEVLGQRPMSQIKSAIKTIDEEIGFELLRPLSAKLLPETAVEKECLVNREELFDFQGRNRKPQMALAEKFKITYPNPGGGCFLCEKAHKKRMKILLEKNLISEKTLSLVSIGRQFLINNVWFVVARDESESIIVDGYKTHLPGLAGQPSVYFNHSNGKQAAADLQKAFSTGSTSKDRAKFDRYKL